MLFYSRIMQNLFSRIGPKIASFTSSTRLLRSFQPRLFSVKVTQKAPNFAGTAVVNGQFKEIQLRDYLGKYLVLFFYPLDFTFVCPTELIAFSDRIEEFKEINCNVIGVSTDSHFSHLSWINAPRKVRVTSTRYTLLPRYLILISF